ncbi:MAG: sulfite exporter TauE/SafE family protein [Rhodocyclales bacterium]|nr:sulfite exporter TauE/SafE family protein [Rhodocyclales bacterium]
MFDHAATLPPAFWLLAVAATLLFGMSKAGFGGAAGSLGVPLIALSVPAPFAAAVMLPILLVLDLVGLVVFRGKADAANLRIILPGAMLGIALGWLTFGLVDARWIKLLIGIEAILFALDRFRAARSSQLAVASAPTFGPGIFWSGIAGFTSFVSHAGGPPIMQYLMPQNMDKMRLVGTTVIFFTVVNFAKLGPYAQLGLVDLSFLGVSLLLAPAIPIGYFAGYRLLQVVDMRGFNLVTAWTLLAAGSKLAHDGMIGP